MGTTCEIVLLGGFHVTVDGRPVPDAAWRHRRAADLVKLLALAPGHRMHREQVMDALWPSLGVDAAGANLRKAVHFARRTLGSDDAIAVAGSTVALFPDAALTVDAERFAEAAHDDPQRAGRLYAGELLPHDPYEPWAEDHRARLRLLASGALKAAGEWPRAIDVDRTDEEAYRGLMRSALDAGDRAAAIRAFETLREALRVDLGVGPEAASITLYEQAVGAGRSEPPTPAQRARTLIAWGLVRWHAGELAEAEAAAEEARALAIDAGLGREVGDASALLGLVANMQGRWPDLFRSEFVRSMGETPELASFVFDAHLCLAEYFLAGDMGHEAAAPLARELLGVAERAGSLQGAALATLLLGEIALLSGALEGADEILARAAEMHDRARAPAGHAVAIERRAQAAVARGQRWRAARLLPKGFRLASSSRLEPHLVVRMHGVSVAAAPNDARAAEEVRRGDAALAGGDVCPTCSMSFVTAAAVAQARAGLLDDARRRLEEGERIAGMWRGGAWMAAVWEARAELRLAEGDHERAAALFREAGQRFEELGRPLDAARCAKREQG